MGRAKTDMKKRFSWSAKRDTKKQKPHRWDKRSAKKGKDLLKSIENAVKKVYTKNIRSCSTN
jgi:hypothetical protein